VGDGFHADAMLADGMSCRTGPLRMGRAFARLFNLSWQSNCGGLPLVGTC
jgi:hypothetical protein